jgi:hypothetical protein
MCETISEFKVSNTTKEGMLIDIQTINTNNKCCINVKCKNCEKCYIDEYKPVINNNNNYYNSNKPLIDLYSIQKKYNIDDIYFNINNNKKSNNNETRKIVVNINTR